ncbi:MAG TPA: DNA-3-methyladenine glycosylase [Gemmatimonadaceae bacterium]|jgi:DNA-3-methyladenine glycosylase|nr:DNA-3-methyladenine glycosylase [Gemmatimonadaceae bacterium]
MTNDAAPSSGARRSRLTAPLPSEFYNRETELVARELLGAVLECRTPDGVASGRIVETEAYIGEHDLACHAAAGRTSRTEPLYGPPGIAYVYFIYGMYWCVNAVTRAEGEPSAVLIRALEPLDGIHLMRRRRPAAVREIDLANGPGKLCLALGIDGRLNRHDLARPPLRVLPGEAIPNSRVRTSPRIGISRSADWPLRWFVVDNPYVSRSRVPSKRQRSMDEPTL